MRGPTRRAPKLLLALAVVGALLAAIAVPAGAGAGFFGSTGGTPLNRPIVGMAPTPTGDGYWLVASDGGIFAFGDAAFHGSAGGAALNRPIVGMAPTPTGDGYWLVASDGGIFAFGDARFLGSTGATPLNQPIVGMAPTPTGDGYWLVASDGGIFAFGDARFLGSTGATPLNRPIVGMAPTPTGDGYWLVASDGGIFAFGDARFLGSTGATPLNRPIVGMAPTPTGDGYWLVASDGGIFAFGDAAFHGSAGGAALNRPIVGMAPTPTGDGYWLVASDGGIFAFPSDTPLPQGPPSLTVTTVVSGLEVPWDLAFAADGTMIFTERPGRISARLGDGTVRQLAGGPTDVRSTGGEGGLLGLALHPAFGFLNRWVYACFASTAGDVRVARWSLDPAFTTLSGRVDVVTGMPHNAASDGRHSGCRPRFGPDGFLWIGTGDAATGGVAQDLGSPGGKVLRVDAEGNPAPGNPFPGSRVYTYGHRNVQGLAFQPGTGRAYSVEHGPTRDDEVNLLVAGADYGWAPPPGGYDESVPMTRPGATGAVWSSGSPTLATSGGTFLDGPQWKAWDGALVVACLKSRQVVLFVPNFLGGFSAPQTILTGYGRLRTPVQGPDGSLYVTTSDSGNDRVLRVTPG